MIHLPFINKYPYTSMEAVNIDWLLNEVSKIPVLEDKVNQHETRITTLEETAADHEQRLTAAEGDIDALEGRMDTAEGDISDLKDHMQTVESDIDSLEGRMNTGEGDISDLKDRMQTAEGDIDQLQTDMNNTQIKDQQQDNDISGLDSRVSTLEQESAVIANPGGTGPLLNTVSISGTTYSIDNSGGGGGGGSSVTPNPAGTATDTLEKIDIDGVIYDLPISTTEVTQITNNITEIQGDVSDVEDEVSDIKESFNKIRILNRWDDEWTFTSDGTVQTIPASEFTLPQEDGIWLILANFTVNTSNWGSAPRNIGAYIRDMVHQANLDLGKFYVTGNEHSMITTAANFSLFAIARTQSSDSSPLTIRLGTRIQASSNKQYGGYFNLSVIKLRDNLNA